MQLVVTTLDSSAGLENYTKVYTKREDIWQAFQTINIKSSNWEENEGI